LYYIVPELPRWQAKNGNGYVGGIPQLKVFWERIRNKIPETEQFNKILYLKSVQIEKNIHLEFIKLG